MEKTNVKFLKWREVAPFHYQAQFIVRGHHTLPEGAIVSCDALRGLGISLPEFPSYIEWRMNEFHKERQLKKFLEKLCS